MIKELIKKVCHKLYSIGRYEDLRQSSISRANYFEKNAIIGESTLALGEIVNEQGVKSKIKIGSHCSVMGELFVYKHGGELTIGDYCFIGPRTRIQSALNIVIGNRVLIAHDVNIMDNNSHPIDSLERHLDFARFLKNGFAEAIDLQEAEIIIEDDVWIGYGASILKGVSIGKGAIIGSNTVITKDVPSFAVVVGNPPRIVKYTS